MDNSVVWYENISKPFFAPPAYLFGIVWSILYPIIIASFTYTVVLVLKKQAPKTVLLPLILNALTNVFFSYIQFELQNNYLAALDISIVLISLIWFAISVRKYSRIIFAAQIPYIVWVSFATILQMSILWLNR